MYYHFLSNLIMEKNKEYKTKEDVLRKFTVRAMADRDYAFLLEVPDYLLTPDIITKILKQNSFAIQYLTQTEDICLEAVKLCGYALLHVKNKTDELCMEAINEDGLSLQFIEDQTPEMCLKAIKKNPSALQFVHNQTTNFCLEAVKRDGHAFIHVHQQTPEICLEALKSSLWLSTISCEEIMSKITIIDQKYLSNVDDCMEKLTCMVQKNHIIMKEL